MTGDIQATYMADLYTEGLDLQNEKLCHLPVALQMFNVIELTKPKMSDLSQQRVTVLIGEPMEFTETVEEYRKAKKTAVS